MSAGFPLRVADLSPWASQAESTHRWFAQVSLAQSRRIPAEDSQVRQITTPPSESNQSIAQLRAPRRRSTTGGLPSADTARSSRQFSCLRSVSSAKLIPRVNAKTDQRRKQHQQAKHRENRE